MNKLSPEQLGFLRRWPAGDEGLLVKHIDAITAEHNEEANRLSEQCDELTKLTVLQAERINKREQQMMAMSDDLLVLRQQWRDRNDT